MIPYSSIEFYQWLVVLCLAIGGIARYGYGGAMFAVTWACIIAIFGKDTTDVLLFLGLTYGVYRASCRWQNVHSLVFVALMVLPMVSLKIHWETFKWAWFLGLSFITFRAVGLMLDTRLDENRDNEDGKPVGFMAYTNFLMFAPAILAGPIDRWHNFKKSYDMGVSAITRDKIQDGLFLIILGSAMSFFMSEWVWTAWLNNTDSVISEAYAYAVYLYFDFAGYSNMAIGVGLLFGYRMPINFNAPYLAHTPQDFWNRWHVSLSHWLRDYLFQPFYMMCMRRPNLKKHRLAIQNTGIFMVLMTMGLWNGVEVHYILSGVIFALLSIIHNSYTTYAKQGASWAVFPTGKLGRVLSTLLTFHGAVFALFIFSGRIEGL